MRNKNSFGAAVFMAAIATGVSTARLVAQDAAARGLEIAVEADRRDSGFGDFTAELTMTLRNRHGQESVREMRNRTLEVLDDGDKTLVFSTDRATYRARRCCRSAIVSGATTSGFICRPYEGSNGSHRTTRLVHSWGANLPTRIFRRRK